MEDINREENTKETMENEEVVSKKEPRKDAKKKASKSIWARPWLWILIIIIIGGGIAWGMGYLQVPSANNQQNNSAEENGNVVATVNGEKLTKDQLNVKVMQTKQSLGTSTQVTDEQIEKQSLTSLINEALILQDAEKKGVKVSDKEVTKAYDKIVNNFDSQEAFEKELEKQNLTKSDLKENVKTQLLTQKYLTQNINTESINVTEKEITQAYDKIKSQKDDIPPLEQVKSQIKQQLKAQKQNQLINDLINKLYEKADIQKNL